MVIIGACLMMMMAQHTRDCAAAAMEESQSCGAEAGTEAPSPAAPDEAGVLTTVTKDAGEGTGSAHPQEAFMIRERARASGEHVTQNRADSIREMMNEVMIEAHQTSVGGECGDEGGALGRDGWESVKPASAVIYVGETNVPENLSTELLMKSLDERMHENKIYDASRIRVTEQLEHHTLVTYDDEERVLGRFPIIKYGIHHCFPACFFLSICSRMRWSHITCLHSDSALIPYTAFVFRMCLVGIHLRKPSDMQPRFTRHPHRLTGTDASRHHKRGWACHLVTTHKRSINEIPLVTVTAVHEWNRGRNDFHLCFFFQVLCVPPHPLPHPPVLNVK